MKNNLVIVAILAVVIIFGVWWFMSSNSSTHNGEAVAAGVAGDAEDLVTEFYLEWLAAESSTSTNPYDEGLATGDLLSERVEQYLAQAREDTEATLDPVLCQEVTPEQLAVSEIFARDGEMQFRVIGRGAERTQLAGQSIVTITGNDEAWEIQSISCSFGESGPEREFSFMQRGQILKSVPAPYNSEYWHIVFMDEMNNAQVVPLFFDDASTCIASDGSESVCQPDSFTEPSTVSVSGSMTESGAQVQRLDFAQ